MKRKTVPRTVLLPRTPSSRRPLVALWLDADVEAYFRRTGRGWQSRINLALRKAAKLPADKRKKA